jgi:hypothetical protein
MEVDEAEIVAHVNRLEIVERVSAENSGLGARSV